MVRGLSPAEILDVWERGQRQSPVERSLLILGAATGAGRDALGMLSLGQRDALLLQTRRASFGDTLNGCVACPACDEQLEFSTTTDALLPAGGDFEPEATSALPMPRSWDSRIGEIGMLLRAPNSLDLLALPGAAVSTAARLLAERCVIRAWLEDEEVPVSTMSEEWASHIADQAHAHDPHAEILLAVVCPKCSTSSEVLLDVVAFFWQELAARAQRLLREIHLIARVYGWAEADILALSAARRQTYIALIEGA